MHLWIYKDCRVRITARSWYLTMHQLLYQIWTGSEKYSCSEFWIRILLATERWRSQYFKITCHSINWTLRPHNQQLWCSKIFEHPWNIVSCRAVTDRDWSTSQFVFTKLSDDPIIWTQKFHAPNKTNENVNYGENLLKIVGSGKVKCCAKSRWPVVR